MEQPFLIILIMMCYNILVFLSLNYNLLHILYVPTNFVVTDNGDKR